MRTRTLAIALFLAVAAPAAAVAPTFAQSDDALTVMARTRFKEGVAFYDKAEYEQARASFLQAYALKKHPAILQNLAWSCLKSGHALEAERYFKQFLAEKTDLTDKEKADANDGLSQSRAKLGRIEVVAPQGTDVMVDGEKAGTTPLDAIAVEAGAHTVKFKGSDGTTDTESVTVLAGEKAQARFARSGGTTPPTSTTTTAQNPPPPGDTGSGATMPAPSDTGKPADTGPTKETPPGTHKSLLSPPKNIVPAVVLGGVGVVGFGIAIGFLVSKGTAQGKADDVANQIRSHGGGNGTCANPNAEFKDACSAFVQDNNDVNTDATIGNIGVVAGIVGLAGAAVYWVLAPKKDDAAGPGSGSLTRPVVTPLLGRSVGGLEVSGSF
jgi:hypothetical protein